MSGYKNYCSRNVPHCLVCKYKLNFGDYNKKNRNCH